MSRHTPHNGIFSVFEVLLFNTKVLFLFYEFTFFPPSFRTTVAQENEEQVPSVHNATTSKLLEFKLHEGSRSIHCPYRCNSRTVSWFSPADWLSAVPTSPSLSLLAAWAAWAPPGRPLLLGCALPCHGRDCGGPGGSWWTSANTGMWARRGAPPAGLCSTFPL